MDSMRELLINCCGPLDRSLFQSFCFCWDIQLEERVRRVERNRTEEQNGEEVEEKLWHELFIECVAVSVTRSSLVIEQRDRCKQMQRKGNVNTRQKDKSSSNSGKRRREGLYRGIYRC